MVRKKCAYGLSRVKGKSGKFKCMRANLKCKRGWTKSRKTKSGLLWSCKKKPGGKRSSPPTRVGTRVRRPSLKVRECAPVVKKPPTRARRRPVRFDS